MKPIPEAVKPSMERARGARAHFATPIPGYASHGAVTLRKALARSEYRSARMETRETLRALRALRRQEEAGILGIVK